MRDGGGDGGRTDPAKQYQLNPARDGAIDALRGLRESDAVWRRRSGAVVQWFEALSMRGSEALAWLRGLGWAMLMMRRGLPS